MLLYKPNKKEPAVSLQTAHPMQICSTSTCDVHKGGMWRRLVVQAVMLAGGVQLLQIAV